MRVDSLPFISSCWGRSCCLTSRLRTSITVEIVSPGPSRATIEARPERAADRAPAHGRTSLPPRGPVGCCRRGTRRPRRLIGKCRAGAAAGNVSAEGEAIRSNDYRKDTTVKAPSTRPAAVLGLDVGKSSHWACLIDRDGEVLASAPVRNREAELDALFASAPAGTLVVVDQFRNIGSLAVRRARAAGLGVAHLPGLAASRAAGLFAGEAKTDERDAAVIARTALGVPDSLSGVPGRGEALEAARALSSQRDHVVACATRDKNRLRAVLLESCPALEAAVDLSDRRWLELLAGFGGAWGIARSGAGGPRAEAAGEAAAASTAPPPALVEAENRQVRFLAARISEALDDPERRLACRLETRGLARPADRPERAPPAGGVHPVDPLDEPRRHVAPDRRLPEGPRPGDDGGHEREGVPDRGALPEGPGEDGDPAAAVGEDLHRRRAHADEQAPPVPGGPGDVLAPVGLDVAALVGAGGDETYACLLTVPGIGPRTAAQLAVSVDIARFPDHDHLASYCGIAPRVRSSGTSVRSVRASRRGDARLKSLLIFSCNSLVRSSGRYGEYYRACRARGMGHGRALKAVARKRLRAIYAVMRDRVPYRE